MVKDPRDLRPDTHYGPIFWQVIGLLANWHFESKAELVKELSRINGKTITRQQVYTIIKTAVEAGFIDSNPFPDMPQMSRRI